jgi:hypothetical protein
VLVLDVEKPLRALAQGQPVTAEACAFLAPDVLEEVDAELRSWWPHATAAHAPVLLAWAALRCLAGQGAAAAGHALRAHQAGGLGALAALSSPRGMRAAAAEMGGTIALSATAAVLGAFQLDPGTTPAASTDRVVALLSNVFGGQQARCEAFWAEPHALLHAPVRHFLDGAAALFPALPAPLLAALTALTAGPAAAAAANAYLAALPALTSLHLLPDDALASDPDRPEGLVAARELAVPGCAPLTLPEGAAGRAVPLPEGAAAERVWTARPSADPDSLLAVRWALPLSHGDAHQLQLCRAFAAMAAARGGGPGGAAAAPAALLELQAALALFAALCRNDAATAADLLHVQVPPAEGDAHGRPAAGGGGLDLLSLATQAAAALAALDPLPAAAVGHCFTICAALAPIAPGRVLAEMLSAAGVTPLALSMAAAAGGGGGGLPEVPLLQQLAAAEAQQGAFPATQAALAAVVALLQAAAPAPALAVLVSHVVQRVMPALPQWRFAARAQRWRLTSACLNVVRHALLAAPCQPAAAGGGDLTPGEGPLAAAVSTVLRLDAGAAACLFPLLPPDAATLEVRQHVACMQRREYCAGSSQLPRFAAGGLTFHPPVRRRCPGSRPCAQRWRRPRPAACPGCACCPSSCRPPRPPPAWRPPPSCASRARGAAPLAPPPPCCSPSSATPSSTGGSARLWCGPCTAWPPPRRRRRRTRRWWRCCRRTRPPRAGWRRGRGPRWRAR